MFTEIRHRFIHHREHQVVGISLNLSWILNWNIYQETLEYVRPVQQCKFRPRLILIEVYIHFCFFFCYSNGTNCLPTWFYTLLWNKTFWFSHLITSTSFSVSHFPSSCNCSRMNAKIFWYCGEQQKLCAKSVCRPRAPCKIGLCTSATPTAPRREKWPRPPVYV